MKKKMLKAASLAASVAAFTSTAAVADIGVTYEAREAETFDAIANVQGDFAFDQAVTTPTDDVFSLFGTVATSLCAKPGYALGNVDVEDHYVNVSGKVQKAHSFSLKDIKQMAQESNHIVCSCGSGNAVAQIDVTGIPVSLLVEMADIAPDVNTITVKSSDGYGIAMPLQYVLDHEALLVYQINGQDIPAEEGSLQLFMPATVAKYFTRQVAEIELTAEAEAPAVEEMPAEQRAKVGIMNRVEGQFTIGDRLVFEGYADDNGKAIAAIEFSMDNGETWTTCETKDATADRWVYWYFGYNCEAAGSYKLDVRAVAEDGTVSPLAASVTFSVAAE